MPVNEKEKIGLFGGSFDPVHTGHLILAQMAADFAGLERILFVPTATPPHKSERDLSPFEDRITMVRLAIEGNAAFELSLLEGGETPSYTWESLDRFARQGYDREHLHLIVGSDSLGEMSRWRNPGRIFESATIISMARPGGDDPPAPPAGAAVIVLDTGSNNISSSEIRERVRGGRSIRYLVPEAVERYIIDRGLYTGS
jgi:nicotinate-nucleotide adenylyltransferase